MRQKRDGRATRDISPHCLIIRTAQAADTIGARALLVHAKDESAKAFYQHFTFETSPSEPYHLLLITKDLLQIVAG